MENSLYVQNDSLDIPEELLKLTHEQIRDRIKEERKKELGKKQVENLEMIYNQMHEAISVMKEVAKWGREQEFRVWLDEWLTPEELLTEEVKPENFCVGKIAGEVACAFILQNSDTGLDEKVVRKIYLSAGFKIVGIIDYDNGRSIALYELEV